jgi:hypothetical protein
VTAPERSSRERRIAERRLERSHRLLGPRLLVLFLAGCLAFGHPFVGLFSGPERIAGIPALFVYLFAAWALFIAVLALLIDPPGLQRQRGRKEERDRP